MINRTQSINDYKKANYKRFIVELPKDKYEEVKKHSQEHSESVNGFIKRAIEETMKNDNMK